MHNEAIDRKNFQVVEIDLFMIFKIGVPMKYWEYESKTFVHLINHLLSRTLDNKDPFKALLIKFQVIII